MAAGTPRHETYMRSIGLIDGTVWYRIICCCGWRSGLHGYPGRAEQAGRDHQQAKEVSV